MPSTVAAAMDQRLEEGMTYIYPIMQAQPLQVTVSLATHTSVQQDSRRHSSRELEISRLRISKCLDFTSENKHVRGQQVNCHPIYILGFS